MKTKLPRHYSYRVDHDLGFAPHLWRNVASVCGCKTTTIEQWAVKGSWVVGIGGRGTGQSDELIHVMKVTSTPTYAEFRFLKPSAAAYLAQHCLRDEARVLVSEGEFYYFGNYARTIPTELRHIIHSTQGCKKVSNADVEILKARVLKNFTKGKHGSPNNAPVGTCSQHKPA